ncbi:hypothetical protein [uncultured Deinococcus sp.]|uniref:hypothetical protein n=1 Tax=uncultured Deinococcus sp. TaxID=158789 RepID=UPI0025D5CB0E|nr:hypothetical protein [uncultured Deinococcus sp.]
MTQHTPERNPSPSITLTRAQARVLALLIILMAVVAFAIGFKFMTLNELAAQVVQGVASILLAVWPVGRK